MRKFKIWVEIEAVDDDKGEYIDLADQGFVDPFSLGTFDRLEGALAFVMQLPGLISHPNDPNLLQQAEQIEREIDATD